MQIESTITINTKPAEIFNIYSQVNQWAKWDPDTISASLDGNFTSKSVINLESKSGGCIQVRLLEVIKNQSFVTESKLLSCSIRFEHCLQPMENKTFVKHKIVFSGFLNFIFYLLLKNKMKGSLNQTLLALKNYAETNSE